MRLIDNWRAELNKLWSVRAAIFTALLGVSDQILGLFQAHLPPVTYALCAAAIIVLRVLDQPK